MAISTREGEPIKGVCYIHSETGTEGGLLSVFANTPPEGYWERLHYIKIGDYLTVYSPGRLERVLWSGVVDSPTRYFVSFEVNGLDYLPGPTGVRRADWIEYFTKKYPASLIEVKREEPPKPKPIRYYWKQDPNVPVITGQKGHWMDFQEWANKNSDPPEVRAFFSRWIERYKKLWGEQDPNNINPKKYWKEYRKFFDEENEENKT